MVRVKEDLTGRRFGKWQVLYQTEDYCTSKGYHYEQWMCQCDCGNVKPVLGNSLKRGLSKSCKECNKYKYFILGEKRLSAQGEPMSIIEWNGAKDLTVRFEDTGYVKEHCAFSTFEQGIIRNPLNVMVTGVKVKSAEYVGEDYVAYVVWTAMIDRANNQQFKQRIATYKDCAVCEEWLSFKNFAQWYYDNMYFCGDEKMCVDKDILYKGNKLYSPKTCLIVPHSINMLFVKSDKTRGQYPIGVSKRKDTGRFRARLTDHNHEVNLGCFDTPEEAFQAYKKAKEQHIKDVADEYKAKYPDFPKKLYDAMYAYEVEITD